MQDTDFGCFHKGTVAVLDCSPFAGSADMVDIVAADFDIVLVGIADFVDTDYCFVGNFVTVFFHFAYAYNNSFLD